VLGGFPTTATVALAVRHDEILSFGLLHPFRSERLARNTGDLDSMIGPFDDRAMVP
jgi:hypothetical protein